MTIFKPILQGGTFTFHVGTDQIPFVIHKKVVEDISDVLAKLMNNGAMQESTDGVARLPDTDPDTFALFSEFAYTGAYRVMSQPSRGHSSWLSIFCHGCKELQTISGVQASTDENYMKCPDCGDTDIVIGDDITQKAPQIASKEDPTDSRKRKRAMEPTHADIFERRSTLAINQSEPARGFRIRPYPALGMSHVRVKNWLDSLVPADPPTQDVSVHARLYVFCQTYMIDALKKLCLHKLHRDLIEFEVTSSSVHEIVELLSYTYDNTTDNEDESDHNEPVVEENAPGAEPDNWIKMWPRAEFIVDSDDDEAGTPHSNVAVHSWPRTRSNRQDLIAPPIEEPVAIKGPDPPALTDDQELRDLVNSYAVANAQELMKHAPFKTLLYHGGPIVCDFTKGLTSRLNAA